MAVNDWNQSPRFIYRCEDHAVVAPEHATGYFDRRRNPFLALGFEPVFGLDGHGVGIWLAARAIPAVTVQR